MHRKKTGIRSRHLSMQVQVQNPTRHCASLLDYKKTLPLLVSSKEV